MSMFRSLYLGSSHDFLSSPSHPGSTTSTMVYPSLAVVLLAVAIFFPGALACRAAAATPDLVVYSESLASTWDNWSWDSTLNFAAASPVHVGSSSLSVTYTSPWAGLYLHSQTALPGHGYASLQFWVHGGSTGGQQILIVFYDDSPAQIGSGVTRPLTANTWELVDLPLSSLGSPETIGGIVMQEAAGSAQSAFFLDEIILVGSDATPTPSPTPGPGPALAVNAAAGHHLISPFIYGMNFAEEALAEELSLPVRRWGGNATTRFNWRLDVSNRGSDWYFENIANDPADVGALPDGSETDLFVEQDRRTGTRTILTMPLIGWTPKSRERTSGFSVAKYGPQEDVDPWCSDCGNGVLADGTLITGNDPLDTSVAITPDFVTEWIEHLIGRYGTAESGGVAFYCLDNEPMLWNSTHRDVHPAPASYDEMASRTLEYAAAIKAADPSAATLGPVLWGWTAYFYSALDAAPGGAWWNNPLDRNAHGGIAFIEWYLQQMRDHEQQHGIRLLDYVDVHCYPQASGVSLSGAGDTATQERRLRSTRSLWDPTYTDESWIGEPVRLIPRMKEWVGNNYPGTKLAVTEYNWGALDHINGAVAQADVLGIFGREGLDLATLWGSPTSSQPGAYAFRMYRNYDGSGSAFGDLSVEATSADQASLSIYAARRSDDDALCLMIVNKSALDQTSTVSLAGYAPTSPARVYRYSAAHLNAIVRESDQTVSSGGFEATFPKASITLVVLLPETEPPAGLSCWILH